MKRIAVVGTNFGDEGKGVVTNYLANKLAYPVVRYSAGPQAGHTVVVGNKRFVFSSFGSGTLANVPTYLTKEVFINPQSITEEYYHLRKLGIHPVLYIHKDCPVITPFDTIITQDLEGPYVKNGTCGHGVGAAATREESFYSLKASDLYNDFLVANKLQQISAYYRTTYPMIDWDKYSEYVRYFGMYVRGLRTTNNVFLYSDFNLPGAIFESSQGLLLDPKVGIFPHVTRTELSPKHLSKSFKLSEIYFVTRAYITRHGNGPIPNNIFPSGLILNPNETNIKNEFQGDFRIGTLDLDLLLHTIRHNKLDVKTNLVITCVDQFKDSFKIPVIKRGNVIEISINELCLSIKESGLVDRVFINQSEESNLIEY